MRTERPAKAAPTTYGACEAPRAFEEEEEEDLFDEFDEFEEFEYVWACAALRVEFHAPYRDFTAEEDPAPAVAEASADEADESASVPTVDCNWS